MPSLSSGGRHPVASTRGWLGATPSDPLQRHLTHLLRRGGWGCSHTVQPSRSSDGQWNLASLGEHLVLGCDLVLGLPETWRRIVASRCPASVREAGAAECIWWWSPLCRRPPYRSRGSASCSRDRCVGARGNGCMHKVGARGNRCMHKVGARGLGWR